MSDDQGNCLPLCPTACFSGEITSQSASIIASLIGNAIMPRRTIRLTGDVDQQLQSTAKTRGYANASAFLRAAINHELRGREDTMIGAEERIATSMDQMRREIFRLGRAQQALFAFVDSLAKILLTCVPEPGGVGTPGCSRSLARRWLATRTWQCRSW